MLHPRATDQPIFAFAGLCDLSRTDAGERVESVTHITVPANPLLSVIHNAKQRMPAILRKTDRVADRDVGGSMGDAATIPSRFNAGPVSTRVNAPRTTIRV